MPFSLVTYSLTSPVSTFARVTVAPEIAAPLESVTVPRMSPVFVLWAKDRLAAIVKRQNAKAKRTAVLIGNACDRRKCFTAQVATREDTAIRKFILRLHTPFFRTTPRTIEERTKTPNPPQDAVP